MKQFILLTACAALFTLNNANAQKHLYLDVHHVGAGKVTTEDLAAAHKKDLATQKKYGVDFIRYWFDETNGDVYCLASGPSAEALQKTHGEAHGLLADKVIEVPGSKKQVLKTMKNLYLDVHELGAGNVTAAAVADAHKKDLAVQGKYNVNFVDYWVNEKTGVVVCLAQASDSSDVINTHKEAHGLLPKRITKLKQGK